MSNNADKKLLLNKKVIENLSTSHNYFNNNLNNKLVDSSTAAKRHLNSYTLNNFNNNSQNLVFIDNKVQSIDKNNGFSTTLVNKKTQQSTQQVANQNNFSNINFQESIEIVTKNPNDDTTTEEIMKSKRKVELWLQQNHEYFQCRASCEE